MPRLKRIEFGRLVMAGRKAYKRLGDLLVEAGVISEKQRDEALDLARRSNGKKKVGEVLIDMGYTTNDEIVNALSVQLEVPRVTLSGIQISDAIVNLLGAMDEKASENYRSFLRNNVMIPFELDAKNPNIVHVAMADPQDYNAMDDFSVITNYQAEPYVSTSQDIMIALDKYFPDEATQRLMREFAQERKDKVERNQSEDSALSDISSSPIVKSVNDMIDAAARARASDIHIEALENRFRVRFRIDGALYEQPKFGSDIHGLPAMITRLKIMGGMDISEKRKPQDGRITKIIDRVEYDIRVSMLPTVFGEKCVMRLAKKSALTRDKKDLGFSDDEMKQFDHILKNTNGILLVTGPTGSGKSTTLYTALSELNKEDVNIITVEDPVEANIDGVNQVQVNNKAELTFANALRSILRQDPDIIMIGEIRDGETAEIAVQASITGHLVVSTLHTNSSASTISRLEDMGIESYLLADSMIGVIAQRLVRRLCPNCKRIHVATEDEKELMGLDLTKDFQFYEANPEGCDECDHMGYHGRIGIYEIMTVTPKLKKVIARGGSADELEEAALSEGMHTLRQSAMRLVLDGTTSYKEMVRTTFEN